MSQVNFPFQLVYKYLVMVMLHNLKVLVLGYFEGAALKSVA